MFQVLDTQGRRLHIDDTVKVGDKDAVLIAILSPEECQVVLEGESGTQIVPPSQLTQVRSLYNELISATTMEQIAKLFELAKSIVPLSRSKSKAGTSSKNKKAAAVEAVEEDC